MGGSVRDLGQEEKEAFQALDKRLAENDKMLKKAARNLGELGAEYAEKEHELELSLSKAKLLESMKAPWAPEREEFAATRRAVVLYHLYEIEMAEQKELEARMHRRRMAAQEIIAAQKKLRKLLKEASKNMEILLRHLNQPTSSQILAFSENFLGEVEAFRKELQASENPRLRQLAQDVARYEAKANKTKEQAVKAIEAIIKVKGD
jgi:hypothetical protein